MNEVIYRMKEREERIDNLRQQAKYDPRPNTARKTLEIYDYCKSGGNIEEAMKHLNDIKEEQSWGGIHSNGYSETCSIIKELKEII